MSESASSPAPPQPSAGSGTLRFDAVAGFLVFLIAMPLCLAISRASGFPPIAGIWTAIVGGIFCTMISNSELTIKGPAAGLIVIVYGAVTELGHEFGADLSDTDKAFLGYKLTLGIGITAGVIQILFGMLQVGRLVDLFPLTPVHGMLASIGIIIISKQLYEVFGLSPTKGAGPLTLLTEFPGKLQDLNPEIAVIGLIGLAILFGLPFLAARFKPLKKVPAPLIVLVAAIGLGLFFDLEHKHSYLFPGSFFETNHGAEFEVGPQFLVTMPEVLKEPAEAFARPDFSGLASPIGVQYLILFTLIGSLESLLSAKAIELIDPWRRKTNFDRELLGIGVANTISAAIGGLPMISEIVRSKANIDNGARSRKANLFHGLFLLAFVLLLPNLIHRIPLAALGAMLVYTGFRLASPREFVRTFQVGSEQFLVFIGTIIATLATDLLIGISVGIAMKLLLHVINGCPISALWSSDVHAVEKDGNGVVLVVHRAAVFSNWLGLRRAILEAGTDHIEVTLDLSRTKLVDHSVMGKLLELEGAYAHEGKKLEIVGLEAHRPLSAHPLAARKNSTSVPDAATTPATSASM